MKSIGIDIGGTKIAVAIVDDSGKKLAEKTIPTLPENGFSFTLSRIFSSIDEILAQAASTARDMAGIGIGCTGPVDPNRGTIHNPYTLPTWDDCNLIEPLCERYKMPVVLENDADAAALGEYRFGAGQNTGPMVMLTFGTGVGFSAIVDEKIYRGVTGAHPELGHIPILPNGPECYCGIRGCLESIASGTAIQKAGVNVGLSSSAEVFRNAKLGNIEAVKIVENVRDAMAVAVWTICHSFLPHRILMGGGIMSEHFDLFVDHLSDMLLTSTMIPHKFIAIAPAALGDAAGVIGAASLVMKKG